MKFKFSFYKIVIIFILLICCISFLGNDVYAEINSIYKTSGEVGAIDVDNAVIRAPILESIARFLYAIAGFVENIVGSIVSIFTGYKFFPWADRVIFNTMPLLDINFLSPEGGSLFQNLNDTPTALGIIIRNIYYTIFVLAVTFFGVVVGVMALKLAISSIAAEKAKYKQAITNWLLALILLFTAHYLMSFIFFVNEKMVEVASSVITSQELGFEVDVSLMSVTEQERIIRNILREVMDGDLNFDQSFNVSSAIIAYVPDGNFSFMNSNSEVNDLYKEVKDLYEHYKLNDVKKGEERTNRLRKNFENEIKSLKDSGNWSDDPFGTHDFGYENIWSKAIYDCEHVYNDGSISTKDVYECIIKTYGPKDIADFPEFANIEKQNLDFLVMKWGDTGSDTLHWGIRYYDSITEWEAKTSGDEKWGKSHEEYLQLWYTSLMRLLSDGNALNGINIEEEEHVFVLCEDAAYITLLNKFYGLSENKISKKDFINGIKNLVKHSNDTDGVGDQYDLDGDENDHYEKLWEHVQRYYLSFEGEFKKEVFTGMADFFRQSVHAVYTYEDPDDDGKEKVANFNAIPAILYSIFVVQSIMYFIAYLKRFFYILVLALFAPLVVIYDFLTKTAMG